LAAARRICFSSASNVGQQLLVVALAAVSISQDFREDSLLHDHVPLDVQTAVMQHVNE
jgi:hypothetical protein